MRKVFAITFLLLALMACTEGEEQKPSEVMKKEAFVKVLTDIHLVEAMVRQDNLLDKDSRQYLDAYYEDVLEEHDVSRAAFDSSYHYYRSDMEEMREIHEAVLNRLNTMKDSIR